MVAAVEMARPEVRILQGDVGKGYIFAVGDIHQPRTLFVLVRAFGVPLAAQPERPPRAQTIAINRAGAADGKAIRPIGVDEGREIDAVLPLDARFAEVIIGNVIAAHQGATLCHIQIHALLEVQRTCVVDTRRNDQNTATLFGSKVNDGLNLLCMQLAIRQDAVVRQPIGLTQCRKFRVFNLIEPIVDWRSIREKFKFMFHCCIPHSNRVVVPPGSS